MAVRIRPESVLRSPLLVTELSDAFEQICNAFSEEIKPHGFIVRLHVADVAYLTWEICDTDAPRQRLSISRSGRLWKIFSQNFCGNPANTPINARMKQMNWRSVGLRTNTANNKFCNSSRNFIWMNLRSRPRP